MNPIESLKAVLCNPEGKCCIEGSAEDRRIVDEALRALSPPASDSTREGWNIDRDGDGLLVCFSNHSKSEGCSYVRYVPESPASAREGNQQELITAQTEELLSMYRHGYAPEGWVLVPREPTKEMLEAAQGSTLAYGPRQLPKHATLRRKWAAMLAATPTPPATAQEDGSWHPISTAPKDSLRNIALCNSAEGVCASGHWEHWVIDGRRGIWVSWPYIHGEPTHWRELPTAMLTSPDSGKEGAK